MDSQFDQLHLSQQYSLHLSTQEDGGDVNLPWIFCPVGANGSQAVLAEAAQKGWLDTARAMLAKGGGG